MNAPWRLVLIGSTALTVTSFTMWVGKKKGLQSREPLPVITRLRDEIKPWDFFWDTPHSANQLTVSIPSDEGILANARSQSVRYKLLIFVRHGQYNLKASSSDEKVLTDLGWHQAYETGCYLRRLGIRIDRIIHSNLIRARQTTAALLMGLSDASDDTLLDVPTLVNLSAPYRHALRGDYSKTVHSINHSDLGASEVIDPESSRDQVAEKQLSCLVAEPYQPYPGASFNCQESHYMAEGPPPIAPEPPGGRSMNDEVRRFEGSRLDDGFRHHINRNPVRDHICHSDSCDCLTETIVFVGHANVFRYWLCRVLQLPPEAWLRMQLYHGSVSCVELCFEPSPSGACMVTATRIGEVGHLPKELLSR